MPNTSIVVTEKIPGKSCKCLTEGGDCSDIQTAKYVCEISMDDQVSPMSQLLHESVQATSYVTILLGFILFPAFIVLAIVRLVFFLRKSNTLKMSFRVTSIFFLVVVILYF